MKSISYAILVLTLVASLAAGGCGSGGSGTNNDNQNVTENPNTVTPTEDPKVKLLRDGNVIKGVVKNDCDNSVVLESLNTLCDLFGAGSCINQTSKCNDYSRQIYTGSSLVEEGKTWNGRGGSGELMADAALCTLRELSPKISNIGPLRSDIKINIGIGDVIVNQEVGYLDFDRVNPRFKGYRKMHIELPVLGKFDAVSQDIDLSKAEFGGHSFNPYPFAGGYQILFGYGLNLSTEEKSKSLEIKPPAIEVVTPLGPFSVQPTFNYEANTSVADSFVTDHTYWILPPDSYGDVSIRLSDLFGIMPGVANNTTPNPAVLHFKDGRTGWMSQIGLGNRGTGDDNVWSSPISGPFSRPDYDPNGSLDFLSYVPRSEKENEPSVYAKASAPVKYPEDPYDLLPGWVKPLADSAGVKPTAYIQITPTIEAGAGGQFGIALSEGTNQRRSGENNVLHDRLALMGIYSGVRAGASFNIDTLLRIKVTAGFSTPFGDITKDIIDISPHFPIPLAGDKIASKVELASASSSNQNSKPEFPETLDSLVTFKDPKVNPKAFIEQCYAKENEVPPEEPPKPEAGKGNPEDLFPDDIWPCNICIATDEVKDQGGTTVEPAHSDLILPAQTLPTWKCDAAGKSGCMDLCKWEKQFDGSGKPILTVIGGPKEIADGIPASDPQHDFFLSCNFSCDAPTLFLPEVCGGGSGDITPPGIMVPPAPCEAPGPVPVPTDIATQFTEPLKPETVNTNTVTIESQTRAGVTGVVSYDDVTSTVTFTPDPPLANGTAYTVRITGIQDKAGNPIESDFSCDFETEPAEVPEERTAFVTSAQGNGNLSTWADAGGNIGLAAGDAVCQARASAAGLSGNFVAWLSDYNNDAYCRVHNLTGKKSANCGQGSLPVDAGPWVRTDGYPFSETIDQLVNDGKVFAPVMYDEFGNFLGLNETYMTGTNADGTYDTAGSTYTCYDWTGISRIASAIGGRTDGATYSWTHNYSGPCDSTSWRLLCLETGTGAPLPPYTTVGKKVFVTSTSGSGNLSTWAGAGGNSGLVAGDAICQSKAAEAGLANSSNFKAWLSQYLSGIAASLVHAKDRLTSDGPWVRPDGVKVADSKADLTDGSLFTAISQTETGIYLSPSVTVWTGTYTDGTLNSVTSTCEGWTTSTPPNDWNARIGESSLNDSNWTGTGYSPCSANHHLYCFEDQ